MIQEQGVVIDIVTIILWVSVVLLVSVVALIILVVLDHRADDEEWRRLTALQSQNPPIYSPDIVENLPDPARRYFNYTIRPGTHLLTVAEIDMVGRFSLGTKDKPAYQPIHAHQILAAPDGFVWSMRTRSGLPVSGSDTGLWTRFRLLGLIPIARQSGGLDHARSAFGRYVAEAVFWTPAALLPGPDVSWEAVSNDTARVIVRRGELVQSVNIRVDTKGRPIVVSFQRWSNANADKVHRLQPFGGYLSDFRDVEGFRLPHRVEAGNMFETESYFPFFIAEVTSIRFPRTKNAA